MIDYVDIDYTLRVNDCTMSGRYTVDKDLLEPDSRHDLMLEFIDYLEDVWSYHSDAFPDEDSPAGPLKYFEAPITVTFGDGELTLEGHKIPYWDWESLEAQLTAMVYYYLINQTELEFVIVK